MTTLQGDATHPPLKILVTGDREDLEQRCPKAWGQHPLEWVSLPVLQFEALPLDPALIESVVREPRDWIIFSSARAVTFWNDALLACGLDFPIETQVACLGEKTAAVAEREGYTADFYPTEPGTEQFLEEFESLLSNNLVKPSFFIPAAEGGRPTLAQRLKELGCRVEVVSLYRTSPRSDLTHQMTAQALSDFTAIVFTSPSSVEAFTAAFKIPSDVKVGALGSFTSQSLTAKGVDHRVLPGSELSRVGEILC